MSQRSDLIAKLDREPDWKALFITLSMAVKSVLNETASFDDWEDAKTALAQLDEATDPWVPAS